MIRKTFVGMAAALALCVGTTPALAQGTAFTYQGQLKNSGAAVNSATDMQFSLWTAASGGSQVGSTVTNLAVPVSQGLFSSAVDFGVNPYTSSQSLFLQIAVRNPAGSGSYVPMGSRQAITPAPFSLATRGLNVNASNRAGILANPFFTNDVSLTLGSAGGAFPSSNILFQNGAGGGNWSLSAFDAATGFGDLTLSRSGSDFPLIIRGDSSNMLLNSGNSGFVGIGTATPGAKLEVSFVPGVINDPAALFRVGNCGLGCAQEDWQEGIRLLNQNGNGRVGIGLLSATTSTINTVPGVWIGTGNGLDVNDGSNNFHVATNVSGVLTNRLFVDGDNGNTGVGTIAPGTRLDVAGTARTTGTHYIGGTAPLGQRGSSLWVGGNDNGAITFPAGTPDGDKVGIRLFNNSLGGSSVIQGWDYLSNVSRPLVLNEAGGNVSIGTAPSTFKLDVGGTVRCTVLTQTSAREFKQDITPLSGGLDAIMKLNPVTYSWNDKAPEEVRGSHDIGFIADEMNAVLPDIVAKDQSGKPIGIDYGKVAPVAVQAIKQLKSENDQLKARLEKIEAMLAAKAAK